MAISKTWSIQSVDVLTNLFQMQNVVRSITWKLTLENDGEQIGDTLTPPQVVNINGKTDIPLPYDVNSFVPYNMLTESQMLQLLTNSLGPKKDEFEKEAEMHMVNLLATKLPDMTITQPPLPWAT